ncbi:hypothetical protein I3249_05160 [Psychrobacter sp. Ps1]|uniref:hypothetical protein n=1 Tax=Psychrobacter sp. Ps1 TaxID=2790955 RepID=UPI001EDF90C7|nr:hypothetical protein [Psychrobacter sp. Ps1]MCG3842163.1 hypothetical protein [Psychrobacter sp. Ps1]
MFSMVGFFLLISVKIKSYIAIFEIEVMNILAEVFLSIEDVAIYLEEYGYKYNLEKQHEYRRLYSKIYDLNTQNNVAVLFHYYGMLQEEIEEVEYDEDLYTNEPVRVPIYREVHNIHTNDHYHVNTKFLKKILINEEQVEIDRYISKYGDTVSNPQNHEIHYYLHSSILLSSRDIRIPKIELDNLFQEVISTNSNISNNTNSMGVPNIIKDNPERDAETYQKLDAARATIEQQEQEIVSLKNQLEQARTPINISNKEGQGDSLLILGAVMHCIKDAAKKNYTQELLTRTILTKYKGISGISESTLKKKYSEAKVYLQQRLTP